MRAASGRRLLAGVGDRDSYCRSALHLLLKPSPEAPSGDGILWSYASAQHWSLIGIETSLRSIQPRYQFAINPNPLLSTTQANFIRKQIKTAKMLNTHQHPNPGPTASASSSSSSTSTSFLPPLRARFSRPCPPSVPTPPLSLSRP